MRAVRLVRAAASALNLAAFEWSIAGGLARCGVSPAEPVGSEVLPPGRRGSGAGHGAAEPDKQALYNSREPAQMLANLEALTMEAVFILKDLHRHMEDPVVVRRLRDVAQKFSTNRRTVVLTAPKVAIPPELSGLVEFLELPLPGPQRLRQIVDETVARISKTHSLQRNLDAKSLDTIAENLRGLTEEEAERAVSQALVTRYALCPETITDVLEAKKDLLRRSGMLEFVEATENMSTLGGLKNLKRWLGQRCGAWDDSARQFGLEPP
jgi:hypothetical protein